MFREIIDEFMEEGQQIECTQPTTINYNNNNKIKMEYICHYCQIKEMQNWKGIANTRHANSSPALISTGITLCTRPQYVFIIDAHAMKDLIPHMCIWNGWKGYPRYLNITVQ